MLKVLLVADQDDQVTAPVSQLSFTTVLDQVQPALEQEVMGHPPRLGSTRDTSSILLRTVSTAQLPSELKIQTAALINRDQSTLLYSLTLHLPEELQFPAQNLHQICRNVSALRQRVQQLGFSVGRGYFWLPIILTPKGPLYAEVIGLIDQYSRRLIQSEQNLPEVDYCQPVHLSDQRRQKVYELGYCLLESLAAPPATYLIQFGFQADQICFDRLWPFPAKPAIASLGVQEPNLFACHWRCLVESPIPDLTISGLASHWIYTEPNGI